MQLYKTSIVRRRFNHSYFFKKKPLVKIEFDYEIKNQDTELLCTGNTVLAFMNSNTKKPTRCPEYLLKGLGY